MKKAKVLILGASGSGKSTLLVNLTDRYRRPRFIELDLFGIHKKGRVTSWRIVTSFLDTLFLADHTFVVAGVSQNWRTYHGKYPWTHVIYLVPDSEWVAKLAFERNKKRDTEIPMSTLLEWSTQWEQEMSLLETQPQKKGRMDVFIKYSNFQKMNSRVYGVLDPIFRER